MAGTVPELTPAVPCPGLIRICPGIVFYCQFTTDSIRPTSSCCVNLRNKYVTYVSVLVIYSSDEYVGIVIFTALHGMQTRSSDENVRLSVRLSVKHVDCDKTEKDLSRLTHNMKDRLA